MSLEHTSRGTTRRGGRGVLAVGGGRSREYSPLLVITPHPCCCCSALGFLTFKARSRDGKEIIRRAQLESTTKGIQKRREGRTVTHDAARPPPRPRAHNTLCTSLPPPPLRSVRSLRAPRAAVRGSSVHTLHVPDIRSPWRASCTRPCSWSRPPWPPG